MAAKERLTTLGIDVPVLSSGSTPTAMLGENFDGLDELFARVGEQASGWRKISLSLPKTEVETLRFAIDAGSGGQPQLRSTMTLDAATGTVVRWEKFSDNTPGRRLRTWLRFLHTGEALGIIGQTIAGIVTGGAAVLVYTGLALTLRRFVAWLRRRRIRSEAQVAVAAD